MHLYSVGRSTLMFAGLAASIAVISCGGEDKRVDAVGKGMTRDSVLNTLQRDAKNASGIDSMPNVYKRSEYLVNGSKYEVLYFNPENKKFGRDTVRYADLTPIVMVNGTVAGKGWVFWDSVAKKFNLPQQSKDSIATFQRGLPKAMVEVPKPPAAAETKRQ